MNNAIRILLVCGFIAGLLAACQQKGQPKPLIKSESWEQVLEEDLHLLGHRNLEAPVLLVYKISSSSYLHNGSIGENYIKMGAKVCHFIPTLV